MSNLGNRKPNNKIVVSGDPLVTQKNVETATNMYPGRLVKKGTNADDVVVNTAAGACYGWLGYEQVMDSVLMPDDVDSIFTVNCKAPVLYGGHFEIVGCLTTSQTIVWGDRLVAAADGTLMKAVAATATTGSSTASAVDATTPTIDGTVGSDGIVVAIAHENVTTTGAVADIIVLSLI